MHPQQIAGAYYLHRYRQRAAFACDFRRLRMHAIQHIWRAVGE
jgi:hypothetical protein